MASMAAAFAKKVRSKTGPGYHEFLEDVMDCALRSGVDFGLGSRLRDRQPHGIVKAAVVDRESQLFAFRFADGTVFEGDPDGDLPQRVARGQRREYLNGILDERGRDVKPLWR